MSGQYVQIIQPTPFIAADARDLRWVHGLTLRGADALHVASGLFLKSTEFLTTDEKITKSATAIGALGMRVTTPSKTACLPMKYRQEEIFDDKITVLRPASGTNQADRFTEMARLIGVNEDEAAFREKLQSIAQPKPKLLQKPKRSARA
jgi:hypothetical protein